MIPERIKAILTKEFKQIFRDPRMRTIIFVSPLLQIILFGYAANKDINYVPTAIYDKDNTSRPGSCVFAYSQNTLSPFLYIQRKETRRMV